LVSAILVSASVSAQRLYCPSCEAPMHAAGW